MAFTDDFAALPMDMLIGAPLRAACDAQIRLSQATADFINSVGFYLDADKKPVPRQANFQYYKPIETPSSTDGGPPTYTVMPMTLTVPFLALVNVPALCVKTVDIVFDMEIKSSETDSSGSSESLSATVAARYGTRNCGVAVTIHGSVSAHQEHTRTTDKSAKYHVEVHAADDGPPEGLMRVLDMLRSAMGPISLGDAKGVDTFKALSGAGVADTPGTATAK